MPSGKVSFTNDGIRLLNGYLFWSPRSWSSVYIDFMGRYPTTGISSQRVTDKNCSQSEQIRDVFYFTVVINSVREVTEFYFHSTLGVEPKF